LIDFFQGLIFLIIIIFYFINLIVSSSVKQNKWDNCFTGDGTEKEKKKANSSAYSAPSMLDGSFFIV
jgi:hypothetical protein